MRRPIHSLIASRDRGCADAAITLLPPTVACSTPGVPITTTCSNTPPTVASSARANEAGG